MSARLRQAAVQAHMTSFLSVKASPCWIGPVLLWGVTLQQLPKCSIVTRCSTSVSSRYSLICNYYRSSAPPSTMLCLRDCDTCAVSTAIVPDAAASTSSNTRSSGVDTLTVDGCHSSFHSWQRCSVRPAPEQHECSNSRTMLAAEASNSTASGLYCNGKVVPHAVLPMTCC